MTLVYVFLIYYIGATLSASADTTLTVPSNAQRFKALIKVKSGVNVWVSLNALSSILLALAFAANHIRIN